MVIAKEAEIQKQPPIIDESLFLLQPEEFDDSKGGQQVVRFDKDSYIWLFEGRRGGGKTTAMSYFVGRAVALYNKRVVSNYPIEFMVRRHRPDGKTYLQHVKNEPLDFERLLCFDQDYRNILICIDEAPDVISHMASQTWKNRLVAAFTRQIRKNHNTLFLATQDFMLIDKSMRWQVDTILHCEDAARTLGENTKLERGELLWLKFYDHSGLWSGMSTEERAKRKEYPCVLELELFPRFMWGDSEHKAAFDSWYQIDILESLRKVDLRLSKITVGDKSEGNGKYPVSNDVLKAALCSIEGISKDAEPYCFQTQFSKSLGPMTTADRNNMGKLLSKFNVERAGSGTDRIYGFGQFDLDGFREYVEVHVGS